MSFNYTSTKLNLGRVYLIDSFEFHSMNDRLIYELPNHDYEVRTSRTMYTRLKLLFFQNSSTTRPLNVTSYTLKYLRVIFLKYQ